MTGIKGNNKHANKTSYPNQKLNKKNPKVVYGKFMEMLRNSMTDENILSYEDACASIGWRDSKCNYWSKKIPIFATLKNDIQKTIIRRVNKGGLLGEFNPTASIWRMKQLGEIDAKEVKGSIIGNIGNETLTPAKIKEINDMLENEY